MRKSVSILLYEIIKKPPLLHKEKYDDARLNLQEKFYYNMINWKRKALKEFPNQITQMKKLLKESKTDADGNEYPYTISEYKKMVEIKESENEFLKKQITELIENCEDYKRELREIKKKERED